MVTPHTSLRSARTVLVIDAAMGERAAWLAQLERTFRVSIIASLAGASAAVDGQDVSAVVLVLDDSGAAARPLVTALRRHPGLEGIPVFAVSRQVEMTSADLCGLRDIHVLEPSQAEYFLSLQIGASAPRVSARPGPKRPSVTQVAPVPGSTLPVVVGSYRATDRFVQDCAARGERGLALCQRLSQRDSSAVERRRAADELRGLVALIRADARALELSGLEQVLELAEQVLARLEPARAQLIVPRGVVGLLSELRELARGGDSLGRFDADLHRTRLESAFGR